MSEPKPNTTPPPADYWQRGALIPRKVFKRWTGLADHDFDKMVDSGLIRTWKPEFRRTALYYKADAARIAGWETPETKQNHE